jgi:hypothetical protein
MSELENLSTRYIPCHLVEAVSFIEWVLVDLTFYAHLLLSYMGGNMFHRVQLNTINESDVSGRSPFVERGC